MKKFLMSGLAALFVFTLTGYQAEAQQGRGRNRNQALAVLEGEWLRDSTILDHVIKFDRNGNYQLWISKDTSKRPNYEGKVELRGNQITFPKAPSTYGSPAVFEFEVDGDFMLLIDPEKSFYITSSGSRTMHFAKNGAETVDFEVSQVGGNSRNATTTDLSVKFAARRGTAVRDIEEDDIYLGPGSSSQGDAEVDADPTLERGRDAITMTVPIKVNKGGQLRVVILKPGIKFNNKFVTVYDTGPKPQRPPRQRGGQAQQSAPPPQQPPPPPPSRGNQLTESDIKLDEFQGRGIGARFTIKVKCINGETPERYTSMDKVSGYQVELAPLTRNFPRDPERADWKSMEVAFKGINASGNRISSANDSYGFLVSDDVRANVYGRRANPAEQPIVIRVRAKTSDSRSAGWGDWVYLLNDGKGW
jgi:hypothetical protein